MNFIEHSRVSTICVAEWIIMHGAMPIIQNSKEIEPLGMNIVLHNVRITVMKDNPAMMVVFCVIVNSVHRINIMFIYRAHNTVPY